MKTVRFVVEVWVSEDSSAYTAIANALHIEDAEGMCAAPTPGDAAKGAVEDLINKQVDDAG